MTTSPDFPLDAMPQESPALSVVVPCYNEAEGLRELVHRLTAACREAVGEDYEIILVNDGSKDETWVRMNALTETDAHLAAVNLSRNYGHQLALSAGLSVCRGDRILIIDADLQDPPELLGQMIELMDQGADVVYGQRTRRIGESWGKCVIASLFYRLLGRWGEVPIPIEAGDFRLMSRRAVDILNSMPERSRYIRGMVSWIGLKQVPLPYERQPRFAGQTHYPLNKMLRLAMDAVTGFSIIPLRLASYLGAAVGVAGLVVLLYSLYAWLAGETVQGWTSLMVVVLVLGSVQLISLGVFGEYLGRLYMESKRRPLFIIDKIVHHEKALPPVYPAG
ncbi:MAG: glycosyltransferase family 2 protein [Alphaproteobacteria bacterium]|nr:glycosyltransferase family 2 protein [Alphaproteobacteria bacterium]